MHNVMIGKDTGINCKDGSNYNTLIGYQCGTELIDGSYNTIVGSNSTAGPHDCGNIIVGSGCKVYGNHNVVIGDELVIRGNGKVVIKNLTTPLVPFLDHLDQTVRQIQCGGLGAVISTSVFDTIQTRLKFEFLRDHFGYDLGELVYKYSHVLNLSFVPMTRLNT